MWARKRIEISSSQLASAAGACLWPRRISQSRADIAQSFNSDKTFACLSVRSGFDLLLETVDWQSGSQIIFSGLTISDMPRIAREHQLSPVGVDIDWKTLAPAVQEIESRITPQTRAIVIAHLMGGRCKMEKIAALARRYNLMLIEDCAQAYVGNHRCGSRFADVSMFSFGSIKTNTALGGAVFVVRDPVLKEKLEYNHRQWPVQSNRNYLKRVFKYAFVKTISTWPVAAAVRVGFSAVGTDHDSMAAGMARGFAGTSFFQRIRQQPSPALLDVLSRRIRHFDPVRIERRKRRGELLCRSIASVNTKVAPIGFQSLSPTHWVFAVLVERPDLLVNQLWDLGFDATTHSSLRPVVNQYQHVETSLPGAEQILRHIVFLPLDPPMPEREIERLGQAVGRLSHHHSEFRVDSLSPGTQRFESQTRTNSASR